VFKKQEKVNMSDDLVKQLCQWESTWDLIKRARVRIETQAERIEKLEAALWEIIEMDPLRPAFNCRYIARKALEGKDDPQTDL
jgi:hypothetical protein